MSTEKQHLRASFARVRRQSVCDELERSKISFKAEATILR